METPLLAHMVLGPLMLILSLIFKKFPPKKINNFYGYRTKNSMKSQEVWDVSNKYNFNLMVQASLLTIAFQTVAILTLGKESSILYACIVLVGSLVSTIPLTERYIKRNFDEHGKHRSDNS